MRLGQYHSFARSRRSGNGLLWVLVVLAGAGVVWLWWAAGHKAAPAKIPGKTSQTTPTTARAVTAAPPLPAAGSLPLTNAPARPKTNAPLLAPVAAGYPRPAQTILEAQLALDRQGISSGSLDGKNGSQTRAAIRAFQRQYELRETGELDDATKTNLTLDIPALTIYTVTSNDLGRLQPLSKTWTGKSQQTALDYETILELVAERSHSHPDLIRRLNPNANWTNMTAGTSLQVPDITPDDASGDGSSGGQPAAGIKAAFAKISLSQKTLEAFDTDSNLLVHFPCSIAQKVEKRPVGELHVAVIVPNPNYTFDPELFPESAEAKQSSRVKLIIPPGPNNPVGTVWIGLDKPGYGMHGTPRPEDVGRTESHGCFRLANWNAERLLKIVWMGMPVYVEP